MSIYDTLNSEQQKGVFTTEGPVLLLAGAGSGKTRVLTHRIAYLIDEKGVNPYNIMAITFTNKAAKEMRERVDNLVGYGSEEVWVCTFHSTCVRILRRFIDRLGYGTNFTIYDTDDQKSVVKDIIKRKNLDPKLYKERTILAAISSAKDELTGYDEMYIRAGSNYGERMTAEIYREYQETLKKNNAVDFDDLICLTVELFREFPDVLTYYQERFKYIMVDEYQDTNTAQFKLISLLASKYGNLCVVGDDDQSIYKFRGANIGNILNFEDTYPNACVIKLEQNYRSVQNILNAANGVIQNNEGRKDKALWSDKGEGDKVIFTVYDNGIEEAEGVVNDIKKKVLKEGYSYKDCAVLYRTNAQSRTLEERFVTANVPYRVFGGVNFYQRKEIKDILAYLKTVDNGHDDVVVKRIINVPKRGIGATTIAKIDTYAIERDYNFFDALDMIDDVPGIGKAAVKITAFTDFISVLRSKAAVMPVDELIKEVIESTGYRQLIEDEADTEDEIADRLSNLDELVSKAATYIENAEEEPSLSEFLAEVALIAEIDNMDESVNRVSLMTLHSAKGLEFPAVYLVGMEDGLFPSYMAISSGNKEDIEEERRLCYVGITRAMKTLNLSCARQRMIRGETSYNPVSRFVKEIPPLTMEKKEQGFVKQAVKPMVNTIVKPTVKPPVKTFVQKTDYSASRPIGNPKADKLEYGVGDTVSHIKFGTGIVQAIVEGGRDYEVTVDFQNFGVKKMFASFAKLKKQ